MGKAAKKGPTALLLQQCISVYSSHSPASRTLDTHLEQELQRCSCSQSDAEFIRHAVYGLYRYQRFLDCFLNAFYHHRSGVASRQDAAIYRVVAYLALFRLKELGFEQLRVVVSEQEPQQMLVLLSYLFDAEQMQQAVREDLPQVYDKQFVDDTIAGLFSWCGPMEALLAGLRDKVYNAAATSNSDTTTATTSTEPGPGPSSSSSSSLGADTSKKGRLTGTVTIPRPFKLSQPAPKPLPQEPAPSPPPPRKPPPPRRTGPTREQQQLEARLAAERAARRAAAAAAKAPELRVLTQVRSRLPDLQQEAEQELAASMSRAHPPPRPVPPPPSTEVRMTAAAVLREDALYSRKQAKEAAVLQKYEAELRDDAEFARWQERERAAEAERQAARIAALKEAMSASSGAALAARQTLGASRLASGAIMKQKQQERKQQLQQLLEAERQQKAQLCEQIAAERKNGAVAKVAVEATAREKAARIREEQEAAAAAAAARQAAELAAKRDTIMQQRAQELAPKKPLRVNDRTAVTDLAMNDQMSHHELQERLKLIKQHEEEEVQRKKQQAQALRERRAAVLAEKSKRLLHIRQLAATQAEQRRDTTKTTREVEAATLQSRADCEAVLLLGRLQAKHRSAAEEAARVAAENKRVMFEQMQRAAGAAVVEEQKFRSLQEGAERSTIQRQRCSVADAATEDHLTFRDRHVRKDTQKAAAAAAQQSRSAYNERLAAAAATAQAQAALNLSRKQTLAATVRAAGMEATRRTAEKRNRPTTHLSLQERLAALTQSAGTH